jgi:hypothetical protein
MNNDKDFINDPLFKDLRKFAAKETGPEHMPAELFTAFRNAQVKRVRNKWTVRTVIGLVGAAIALPTLSYAHVLPKPVENVVNKVTHFVTTPVRIVASVISSDSAVTPTPSPSNSPDAPIPTTNPTPPVVGPVSPSVPSSGEEENEGDVVKKSEGHTESKKSGQSEGNQEKEKSMESSDANKSEEPEKSSKTASAVPSIGGPANEGGNSESNKGGEKGGEKE